jgi:broad specificity phosphatase PhoE
VVATHGGPIRVGTAALLGRRVRRLDDSCPPVANCSATVLTQHDGHVAVDRYGHIEHLGAAATRAPAGGPL